MAVTKIGESQGKILGYRERSAIKADVNIDRGVLRAPNIAQGFVCWWIFNIEVLVMKCYTQRKVEGTRRSVGSRISFAFGLRAATNGASTEDLAFKIVPSTVKLSIGAMIGTI
jgi:hypothetical protein